MTSTCIPAKSFVAAGIISLALLPASAFTPAAEAQATVRIGVFGPMTGDAAGYGNSLRETVDMVVKKKNEEGGVLGQQIEIIYCDDAGKPEQAVNCAQRLTTRDNVSILLGSVSSPASLAASQVAQQRQTPQIVIAGTAQKITKQGNPWVFRSAVPDVGIARDLANFINEFYPDAKRIGFIHVNDDFGKGGLDAFRSRASELGMELVATESYTRGDLDFTAQISRIRAANPDALIDWSRYAEGSLIAKQLQATNVDVPKFASDGSSHPKFRELAGDAANGWYYATPFSAATAEGIPGAGPFMEQLADSYNKDPDFVHALAWDAIHAAFMAIETAGSTERQAIRDALRNVDFEGVRGRFSFDEYGDPHLATPIVLVKDGKETNARAQTH